MPTGLLRGKGGVAGPLSSKRLLKATFFYPHHNAKLSRKKLECFLLTLVQLNLNLNYLSLKFFLIRDWNSVTRQPASAEVYFYFYSQRFKRDFFGPTKIRWSCGNFLVIRTHGDQITIYVYGFGSRKISFKLALCVRGLDKK